MDSKKLTGTTSANKDSFFCAIVLQEKLYNFWPIWEKAAPGEMLMPTDQTVNVSGMRPWCWLQRMARFMFVFRSGGPWSSWWKEQFIFSCSLSRWRLRPWPTCTGPCLRMPLPIGSKTVERGHAVPGHEPIITPLGQASGTADWNQEEKGGIITGGN